MKKECDICHEKFDELIELENELKIDGIIHVCEICNKELREFLNKLQNHGNKKHT